MVADIASILESEAVDVVFTVVVAALLTLLISRASLILPHRRLWQFGNPSDLVICVATSDTKDTGEYLRPMTGIGQVRALAHIMPSLERAYKGIKVNNIRLSVDMPGDECECDLICLGGVKNNEFTAKALTALGEQVPVHQTASAITWKDKDGTTKTFEGSVVDQNVDQDFGYVIQAANPFNPDRRIIIVGGSHTYGNVAAARFLVTEMTKLRYWRHRSFCALVKAEVIQGHPAAPELQRFQKL